MIFNMTLGAGTNEIDNLLGLGSSYINYTTRSIPSLCFTTRSSSAYSVTFLQCEEIGQEAFSNQNIAGAFFPKCKTIGYRAFYQCYDLSSISFLECQNIGEQAFVSCSNLHSCNFPKCEVIGSSAFTDCTNLTMISFPECKVINTFAFQRCNLSSNVTFPNCNSVYDRAFNGGFLYSASWNVLKLPKATHIYWRAVANNALDEVWLGSEENFRDALVIEGTAFDFPSTSRTSKPFAIYLPALSLAQLTGNLYWSYQSRPYSIYVPAELLSAYKSATNWASVSAHIFSISST